MAKILIADDEKPLLTALSKKVSSEGFEVIEASNGNETKDKAFEAKPDLVLLDIMMPGKHGIDVYKDIRNSDWGKTTLIIFLSNYSSHPEATKISNKDKNCEYLVKSSTKIGDVIELIKSKLK